MRKKGIAPEYLYQNIPGTYNMKNTKSFFGSILMDIEDRIYLDNKDIIYYQNILKEQIDINQEKNLSPNVYSITSDKLSNHSISIDPTQSDIEKNGKTRWVIECNLNNILRNYIFAQIKSARTFSGITNDNTLNKSVNDAIFNYIDENIIDRYSYSKIDFYIENILLENNNIKRYEVNFDANIFKPEFKEANIRTNFTRDKSNVRIFYTQKNNSNSYTFNYYFNIEFLKK
jgi:hypothetical protein